MLLKFLAACNFTQDPSDKIDEWQKTVRKVFIIRTSKTGSSLQVLGDRTSTSATATYSISYQTFTGRGTRLAIYLPCKVKKYNGLSLGNYLRKKSPISSSLLVLSSRDNIKRKLRIKTSKCLLNFIQSEISKLSLIPIKTYYD